jgi:3-phosphoshikimate 1-carboxyvinyltransferase
MRFVPVLAALTNKSVRFDGDEQAKLRPMGPMLDALEQLGVEIIRENRDFLPFTVVGKGEIQGGRVEIDASASSQFVSGLLLAAAKFTNGVEIVHIGETVPSLPHIEMTLHCLKQAGVTCRMSSTSTSSWIVEPGEIQLPELTVEPDLSNAGPFLCAALANPGGGVVRVSNWPSSTTQPGAFFKDVLREFGASTAFSEQKSLLTVQSDGTIRGVDLDLKAAGEIAPTVAALCTLTSEESYLRGIGHLRGHETDRLAAIITEARRVGRHCEILADGSGLHFPHQENLKLVPATIESYNDHRLATFGAVLGLRIANTRVQNVETTAKTMPNFVEMWHQMLKVG